ncbi:ADP-ribosylation factor-like protein 4D [Dreissena polymorpha]|uniref:Uncharacterized protein n=1 Tax=Dreissena polymorpha TaxID=45954 RepID=A0A9D4IYM6_DREPO|nr:ADP-ribosylation factor-like protein 4D [Dreissena polymorpha]XP_052228433.1 ADP-ribosylation factor-like protein 4D [Dreissena polymorpha]KAH3789470.1 hypothetical protein DPMN_167651 [Dreissena polymorpha]KAH3789559.1 hypothetical protein DPMN_167741 [Dreissena polymorpha]
MSEKNSVNDKIVVLVGGIGTALAAYTIYKIVNRYFENNDGKFYKIKWKGGAIRRKVVVLGLPGAGKSRLLQCFQPDLTLHQELPNPAPTIGLNIVSVGMSGIDYHFFEGDHIEHWQMDISALVWLVDSTQPETFHLSRAALHACVSSFDHLVAMETKECSPPSSLYGVPIVVVAAKQDLPGSSCPADILKAMKTDEFSSRHKVYIVGTRLPATGGRAGLWRLYELIAYAPVKAFNPNECSSVDC